MSDHQLCLWMICDTFFISRKTGYSWQISGARRPPLARPLQVSSVARKTPGQLAEYLECDLLGLDHGILLGRRSKMPSQVNSLLLASVAGKIAGRRHLECSPVARSGIA